MNKLTAKKRNKYFDYTPSRFLGISNLATIYATKQWAAEEIKASKVNEDEINTYLGLVGFREFTRRTRITRDTAIRITLPKEKPLELVVDFIQLSNHGDYWDLGGYEVIGRAEWFKHIDETGEHLNMTYIIKKFTRAQIERVLFPEFDDYYMRGLSKFPDRSIHNDACRNIPVEPNIDPLFDIEPIPRFRPALMVGFTGQDPVRYHRIYSPEMMMSKKDLAIFRKHNDKRPYHFVQTPNNDKDYELMDSISLSAFSKHTGIKIGDIIEVDNRLDYGDFGKRPPLKLQVSRIGILKYGSCLRFYINGDELKNNGEISLFKVRAYPFNSMIRVLWKGIWVEI